MSSLQAVKGQSKVRECATVSFPFHYPCELLYVSVSSWHSAWHEHELVPTCKFNFILTFFLTFRYLCPLTTPP